MSTTFLANFTSAVANNPDGIAVSDFQKSLTFHSLDRLSTRLAHVLLNGYARRGERIGVFLDRGVDLVVAILAILKAGCTFVLTDVTHPRQRILECLNDADVVTVLASARAPLREYGSRCLIIEKLGPLVAAAGDAVLQDMHSGSTAYIVYTSGSTGRPKGIDVPYGAFSNYIDWAMAAYEVAKGLGSILHTSVAFDLAFTSIFLPLAAGRELHILKGRSTIADLADAIGRRKHLSFLKLTPLHLRLLPDLLGPTGVRNCARYLVVGGEALFRADVNFWFQNAPETRIVNEYGPSETVVGCVVHEASPNDERRVIPIGRPISGASIYLLDDQLRAVPRGAQGEIFIGGSCVAHGYIGLPDLTMERFLADPNCDTPGMMMYRTGDVAFYDVDGALIYVGRSDEQIKHRGYRVELGEVEARIRNIDEVSDAAVIHLPERDELIAFLTSKMELNESILLASLRTVLPDFMLPTKLIWCRALPITSNGKVDRAALRDRALQ